VGHFRNSFREDFHEGYVNFWLTLEADPTSTAIIFNQAEYRRTLICKQQVQKNYIISDYTEDVTSVLHNQMSGGL